MKIRAALALSLLLCLSSGLPAQQATKTLRATGRVIAVAKESITIQPGDKLTVAVDAKTRVVGKGVGKKTQALKAEGREPTITDLVDVYDSVTVKYSDTGAAEHLASEIKIHVKAFR